MAATENTIRSEIFHSPAGLEIVTQPFLVNEPLMEKAHSSSVDFINCLLDTNEITPTENVCVLDILMGGRYYRLFDAAKESGLNVHHAEIRAKRRFVSNDWKVKVWHDEERSQESEAKNLEYISSADTILIGDTIGTGTTLKGVLSWIYQQRVASGTTNKVRVIIFTICGSPVCEAKLATIAEHFQSVAVYYANVKFYLNPTNGTDLGFVNGEFIPESKDYIDATLGPFQQHIKCAVWDWGDRFEHSAGHVAEVSEYYDSLGPATQSLIPAAIRQARETVTSQIKATPASSLNVLQEVIVKSQPSNQNTTNRTLFKIDTLVLMMAYSTIFTGKGATNPIAQKKNGEKISTWKHLHLSLLNDFYVYTSH